MKTIKWYTSKEKTKILRDIIDNNLLISAEAEKYGLLPNYSGNLFNITIKLPDIPPFWLSGSKPLGSDGNMVFISIFIWRLARKI